MVTFNKDVAITSVSTAATVALLNLLGVLLAIYPKTPEGEENGLITQHGIKVAPTTKMAQLTMCSRAVSR